MKKDIYNIGFFGLKNTEINIMRTYFNLHSHRNWVYQLVEIKAQADIFLVDLDNESAQKDWHNFNNQYPKIRDRTIFISSKEKDEENQIFHRPLRMNLLVKLLDDILIQKLHYTPPIGEDSDLKFQVDNYTNDSTIPNSDLKYCALVVDDSPTIQTLMNVSLRHFSIKPDITDNGEEGLQIIKQKSYDIAFLDIELSGELDGYKLCKLIKEDEKTKKIPVIMLTSKNSAFDKVKGKMSGANSYLTKPVTQDELETVIKKYLNV